MTMWAVEFFFKNTGRRVVWVEKRCSRVSTMNDDILGIFLTYSTRHNFSAIVTKSLAFFPYNCDVIY